MENRRGLNDHDRDFRILCEVKTTFGEFQGQGFTYDQRLPSLQSKANTLKASSRGKGPKNPKE